MLKEKFKVEYEQTPADKRETSEPESHVRTEENQGQEVYKAHSRTHERMDGQRRP